MFPLYSRDTVKGVCSMKNAKILVTIGVVLIALLVSLTGCGEPPVLTLNENEVELNAGATAEITATATDKKGETDTISVSSSDDAVATATVDGSTVTITGVAGGTATITVTSGSEVTDTCEVTVNDIASKGTWQTPAGGYSEQWIISNSSIEYKSDTDGDGTYESTTYKAEIVEFVNGSFNAGDTIIAGGRSPADENPGYAVIKYTQVNNAGTGTVDKYNIFRWCDNTDDATKKDFSQGYKNVGDPWPDNVNGVFDSASAAKSGATNGAGYFGFASSGAEKQQ